MKKGTFIILEENGRFVAAIRCADNDIIRLEDLLVTDAIRALNGKPCEYLRQAQDVLLVLVDGKSIYKALPDSFDLQKAQVPSDVGALQIDEKQVDNFSLKLNRFARFENVEGDEKFYFFNPKARKNKNKKVILQEFEIKAEFNETHIKEIAAKHKKQAEILIGQNLIISNFTPNWRLIVGLGGESVYETSITLHHIYGFPYIPASSIKGVLRSFIIAEVFENDEDKALKNPLFVKIFGSPDSQGEVIFFDALPTEAPKIQPDIINPHYPDYYKNKSAPTDTQLPVPVFFLTVANTPFQFFLGSKQIVINQKLWQNKTLAEWLEAALTQHGIGAKTAVGYGTGELQLTK